MIGLNGIISGIMSTKKLQDKVAVITGASKGLGKAMALALAEAGADSLWSRAILIN